MRFCFMMRQHIPEFVTSNDVLLKGSLAFVLEVIATTRMQEAKYGDGFPQELDDALKHIEGTALFVLEASGIYLQGKQVDNCEPGQHGH